MITKLTPEQEAQIPEFREKWRTLGLSTTSIHTDQSRLAVNKLYTTTNLQPPQLIITMPSPMSCLLARALLDFLLETNIRMNLQSVNRSFKNMVNPAAFGAEGALHNIDIKEFCMALGAQMFGSPDEVEDFGRTLTRLGPLPELIKNKPVYQTTWFWGSQDVYWIALFDFAEHIGVVYEPKVKEHFEAYKNYTLECGWLYPYEHVAFVSDRPEVLKFDEHRRLHRADGPAIRFRDGYSVYAWHGTRVPGWVIETPSKITLTHIQSEKNIEIARCMREIRGHEWYLKELKPKVVHTDEYGRLLESEVNGETWLLVEVKDGTPKPDGIRRTYYLDVTCAEEHVGYPIKTARAAVAATYGLSKPEDYNPTLRT